MKDIPEIIKESLFVWSGSLFVFAAIILIFSWDKLAIHSENFSGVLGFVLTIAFFVGIISFLNFSISSIKLFYKRHKLKEKHISLRSVKLVLILAFLPILLIVETTKSLNFKSLIKERNSRLIKEKYTLKNLGFLVLLILFLIPLWGSGYFIAGYLPANMAGLISEPIPIAGTGSMYPTFPKGEGKDPKELYKQLVATQGMLPYPNGIRLSNLNLFGHEIERGDIIIAENEDIRKRGRELYGEESGIVKRVIALPGDRILIKDGLVYLNGEILKEPYIARARSTFGGEFLNECKEFKIPERKLFLMGDNRKGSGDSRHYGLVDYKDLQYVLPYKEQLGKLDKEWHDPVDDDKESARITLNGEEYLELLNEQRIKMGLKPLKYEKRLESSSKLRGESMLEYDDFSYAATKSGYTQIRAMNEAGYSNIIWNEGISQGSYEAEELIEYLYEFPDWRKNIFEDKDFQDFGIASIRGEVNGCPTQVVVQHLAGYVPPNYTKDLIESWEIALSRLREIQPSWQKLKEYVPFYEKYRQDVDRINDIISIRISRTESVVSTMKANRWLSRDLDIYTRTGDKALFEEQEALATKLNNSN